MADGGWWLIDAQILRLNARRVRRLVLALAEAANGNVRPNAKRPGAAVSWVSLPGLSGSLPD